MSTSQSYSTSGSRYYAPYSIIDSNSENYQELSAITTWFLSNSECFSENIGISSETAVYLQNYSVILGDSNIFWETFRIIKESSGTI